MAVQANALPTNVDLRDLIRFGTTQDRQEANALVAQVNQSSATFGLPPGLTYEPQPLSSIGQFAISTAEVQNVTASSYDLFLVYSFDKQSWLNKVSVGSGGVIAGIQKTDLTKNPPSAQIDILNRQLILTEPKSGFLKYEPVSLGSLVNNRLGDTSSGFRSLSSPFRRAILSRSKSELSRSNPDYYSGRPFLRIVDLDQESFGGFTPFGLHYQISEIFQRGFVSNGCFRLRDVDLYELATMVFFSRRGGVPISVVTASTLGNRHPYPLINTWYNTPRTTTNARGKIELVKIEHGLYVFDKQLGRPDALLTQ